jgi:uncharacterized protein YeaO (DUF488 family)
MIQLKRAYDAPAAGDGLRVLVERLWPRGMKKAALAADVWVKEAAPSTELRKWFDHRVERWEEFQRRYQGELDTHPEAWQPILEACQRGSVTLLYSAHDTLHNGALVLRNYVAAREAQAASKAHTQAASKARTQAASKAHTQAASKVRKRTARPQRGRRGTQDGVSGRATPPRRRPAQS